MITASLNRCKGLEDQVGDFLKQLAGKLELVLLNILRICTWCEVRNFESQTFRLTPPVEESAKKHKSKVLAD